jgi:hypothetical protein
MKRGSKVRTLVSANNVPMFHEGAQAMIIEVEDRFCKVTKQFLKVLGRL